MSQEKIRDEVNALRRIAAFHNEKAAPGNYTSEISPGLKYLFLYVENSKVFLTDHYTLALQSAKHEDKFYWLLRNDFIAKGFDKYLEIYYITKDFEHIKGNAWFIYQMSAPAGKHLDIPHSLYHTMSAFPMGEKSAILIRGNWYL